MPDTSGPPGFLIIKRGTIFITRASDAKHKIKFQWPNVQMLEDDEGLKFTVTGTTALYYNLNQWEIPTPMLPWSTHAVTPTETKQLCRYHGNSRVTSQEQHSYFSVGTSAVTVCIIQAEIPLTNGA